jgi:hypothetical protein
MLKNDEKFSTAFKLILLSLMLAVQSLSFAHELQPTPSIARSARGRLAVKHLHSLRQLRNCHSARYTWPPGNRRKLPAKASGRTGYRERLPLTPEN